MLISAVQWSQCAAIAKFRPGAKIAMRPQVATSQLDTVMGAAFQARPLMSRAEASVFYAAERAMKRLDIKGRVMARKASSSGDRRISPRQTCAIN
ncbi:MAG: hypothetical protein EOP48_16775, partial [Sphingobacteriales bacterium]